MEDNTLPPNSTPAKGHNLTTNFMTLPKCILTISKIFFVPSRKDMNLRCINASQAGLDNKRQRRIIHTGKVEWKYSHGLFYGLSSNLQFALH